MAEDHSEQKSAYLFGQNDYEKNFTPNRYLQILYPSAVKKGEGVEFDMLSFMVEYISVCMNEISGKNILDVGCGPSIARAIPASRRFDEIALADFSEPNFVELRKWLDQSPDAFDWTPVLRHFAKEEGSNETVESIAERVRSKVTKLVKCDFVNDSLKENCGTFEAIISSLALESACPTLKDFNGVIGKMYDALTPGGHVILATSLGDSHYGFDGKTFFSLYLSQMEVLQAFQSAGFRIIKCFYQYLGAQDAIAEIGGVMVTLAQKI